MADETTTTPPATDAAPAAPATTAADAVAADTAAVHADTAAAATAETPADSTATPGVTVVEPVVPVQEAGVLVVQGDVPAQITGPPRVAPATVPANEGHYKTDTVILDTSSPLAVQPLPRNENDLPQFGDMRTPEEKLAAGD